MFITYLLILIYIAALVFIGFEDHKTEDKDGFIIADRKVGVIGTISSASAGFRDGGGLFIWVASGFLMGYGLYNIALGILIGSLILSVAAPRVRTIAKERGYITINQMIRDNIGIKTEKVTSFVVLAFALLTIAAQFYALGNIVETLLEISPLDSVLLCAAVVSFYVCMGGYKSIVKTDILQFCIMLGAWGLLFFLPLKWENASEISTMFTYDKPVEILAGILYGIPIVLAYADFWQKIFSARSEKTAKKSMLLLFPSFLMMTLPLTFIGMSVRGLIPATTEFNNVFPTILDSGVLPTTMIGIISIIGISITMSTLDTNAYLFSSTLLENFARDKVKNSKKAYIYLSKIIMVTMLGIGTIVALNIGDFLSYILDSIGLSIILAPVFIFVALGLFKQKNKKIDAMLMTSILIPFAIGVYMFAQGMLGTFSMRLIPVGISIVMVLITYFFYRHKKLLNKIVDEVEKLEHKK